MGKQENRRRRSDAPGGEAGLRGLRLEELIREELNFLFSSEVNDPRLDGVRVTRVELTRDGSSVRAWITSIESSAAKRAEVDSALTKAAGFFRSRLCEALALKRAPDVRFRRDPAHYAETEAEADLRELEEQSEGSPAATREDPD